MSATIDTFSTPHMIDHEFNDYEFPQNKTLFQCSDNLDTFDLDPEEAEVYYSEDELPFNEENEEKASTGFEIGEMVNILKNNQVNNLEVQSFEPVPNSISETDEVINNNNDGEYADNHSQEESLDHNNDVEDEEQEDNENSITPILLTYCSKKYCIFTDEKNPDTIKGSQSMEQVIFSNQHELYSQSLKSFMQSIQSQFKIINDIVLFFPTLKLKFFSHIPFAEKLSLKDVAFLAANVNPQANILEIELTEEPYNFVSQYQLLINITREELSDEENSNSPKHVQEYEEINEETNLGKRHRNQDIEIEENETKRQKL